MLVEVPNVRQPEKDSVRRWFTDSFFDLIIWYDLEENITGFQLCYDKVYDEHSITWNKRGGYLHNKIDSGETPGQAKMSPILVADGAFDKNSVAQMFKKESKNIDRRIRELVYTRLLEYK